MTKARKKVQQITADLVFSEEQQEKLGKLTGDAALVEIEQVVEEYNEIQTSQIERLRKLFDLIAERKGWRAVYFNNNTSSWTNCWGKPRDMAHKTFVEGRGYVISKVEPGAE